MRTNQDILQEVIEATMKLRKEFRGGKRTSDETRTEAVLLNIVNNTVRTKIQDSLLDAKLAYKEQVLCLKGEE